MTLMIRVVNDPMTIAGRLRPVLLRLARVVRRRRRCHRYRSVVLAALSHALNAVLLDESERSFTYNVP